MTSWDQMAIATLGLLEYIHLDPSKVSYISQVQALLGRMALWLQTGGVNVAKQNALMNIRTMLGMESQWWDGTAPSGGAQYTASNLNPLGQTYSQWLIGQSGYLSPGNSANSERINHVNDKLLATKDTTKLLNRFLYLMSDIPTAIRTWYHVISGLSFTATWGRGGDGLWEWPIAGALSAVTNGVAYDNGTPPFHQVLIGGSRDGLSSRQGEGIGSAILAALEYPGRYLPVQSNSQYMTYEDYARHGIHHILADLQDDYGAVIELGVGTLGTASSVTYTKQCTDLTGYALVALALFKALIRRVVSNPFPANGHDYIQGFGENGGTVTISYLGNLTYTQDLTLPRTDRPLLCGGLMSTPTLTFRPDGTASELTGNTITRSVTMPLQQQATATVRQLPVEFMPFSGTVTVLPASWSSTGGSFTITPSASGLLRVRVYEVTAGHVVTFKIGGVQVAQAVADAAGLAEGIWSGSSGAQTLTIEIGGAMSGGKSTYHINLELAKKLGGAALNQPGTYYMALYTVAPTADGGGTELSGNGYARAAIPNDGSHWSTPANHLSSNLLSAIFNQATADWGNVVAAAMFDSLTGGNFWYWGVLTIPQYVYSGNLMSFPAGSITLTEA
jgi:hypothetical protein